MNQTENKEDKKDKKINVMGSEVVPGFKCKPVAKDPDRPIMYYRHHMILCSGSRCQEVTEGRNLAEEIRREMENMGLNQGKNRIKVSSGNCFGACRFRSVAVIYERGEDAKNNAVWIKNLQTLDQSDRHLLLESLKEGRPLHETELETILIPMDNPKNPRDD
jgi:cobalt-precorrin 5A hydrolase